MGSGCGGGCAMRHPWSVSLFALVVAVTLTADLASKWAAFEYVADWPVELSRELAGDPTQVPEHEPIVVLPYVLSLRLTTNTGAVFGLGKGGQWLFMAVSVLAVGVIGRVFCRSAAGAWKLHVALGMILAGALGNLYDRVRFHAVRDMLWLLPETGVWPWIFNVADAALMVGVGVMVLVMWRDERRAPSGQSSPG